MQLNERQQKIIKYIESSESSATIANLDNIFGKEFSVGRRTILRDVQELVEYGLLEESGRGRNIAYKLSKIYLNKKQIDVAEYFSKNFATRDAKSHFDDGVFDLLTDNIFTKSELEKMTNLDEEYKKSVNKLKKTSPAILRRELERLIIELSWKSSEIEGNTYTLLETEALLKEHRIAEGKDKMEAKMILNHKKALDTILENPAFFEEINVDKIKKIHNILINDMDIKQGFRNHQVGIIGTLYRPPGNEKKISELMKRLVNIAQKLENKFARAFVLLIMIAYIQPFEDGNKRTSRIMANAVLYAGGISMLSYRNVDAVEYKKAMLLFYEQNNITYIKQIFIEQLEFAVRNYFREQ